MSFLENKRIYLSGPIEHDTIEDWRNLPRKVLVDEFKMNLFDPLSDPKQQWSEKLKEAKEAEDYDKMESIAADFVHKDLGIVDRADMVIACLPYKVPTTGTIHEIINSNNAKKPTLLVCPQGKKNIPLWFRGFIPHQVTFGSWEDCFSYLREINEGKHMSNRRLAFIYGLI